MLDIGDNEYLMKKLDIKKIDKIIALSLKEDIGTGDITSKSIIGPQEQAQFIISLKEDAVICGLLIVKHVFQELKADLKFSHCVREGEFLPAGSIILKATGRARAILTGERTALNFMQRLSGIATMTRKYVEAVKGYPVKILDTRKTLPRFRYMEKYAVRAGGGTNHRFGLYDQVLIKENHVFMEARKGPGSIRRCVEKARRKNPGTIVEVETTTMAEVQEAFEAGADIILLDNMSVTQVKRAVKMLKGRVKTEVSGGVNLKNIRFYAAAGVDYISIGSLTHSVKAIDMSLLFLSTA